MFKNIICFPHKLGQQKFGVEKAPDIVVDYLKKKRCKMNIHKVACEHYPHFFYNNINNLYNTNESINHNNFRLNIGGDHSMSIATVAYSLNKYPNCKVIWVDAHADLNTYEKSDSKNYHGMPLSFLTGIEKKYHFEFIDKKLSFNNLLYLGLRSIDSYEKEIIDKYNIKSISCNEINTNTQSTFKEIDDFLDNKPFHLSFDVDGIDPLLISNTGTPVEKGINEDSGIQLLNYLVKKKTLKNMDLTEINTHIYHENDTSSIKKTLDLVYKTIHPLF